MEKNLFIDVAVCVGHDLYFTATNSHCLYKISIDTGIVRSVAVMMTKGMGTKRFAGAFFYNNRIWLVPWLEDYFWIYDIEADSIKRLGIPKFIEKNDKGAIFRRSISVGKYIWLVPNWSKCVMRINMELESFDLYTDWPQGVVLSDTEPNFKCISYDVESEKLYLFREGCNKNIIVDTTSGQMEILDIPVQGEFGCVKGNRIIVAPVNAGGTLRVFKIIEDKRTVLEREIFLPKEICMEATLYAYWYVDYIAGKWYILPHDANAVLIMDKNLNLKIIDETKQCAIEKKQNDVFSKYETIKIGSQIWILPFEGNQILALNEKDKVVNKIDLKISMKEDKNELEGLFAEILEKTAQRETCKDHCFDGRGKNIYEVMKYNRRI